MKNYKTILNKEFPNFCTGKLNLTELIHICIDDSSNDSSILGRSRVNKILDEIMDKIKKSFKLSHISIPTYDGWESGVFRICYRGLVKDVSMSITGSDLLKLLGDIDKYFESIKTKNFNVNDDLKKFTPEQRQNFIVDQLTLLASDKLPNNTNIKEAAELILKTYLLDCGESIDVDFSENEKVNDSELWLSTLEGAINEIPKQTKSLSKKTMQKGLDLIIEAGDFIELVKNDFKTKSKSLSSRIREYFSEYQ